MKVGIDIMGGDYAPKAVVEGIILASGEVGKDTTIVMFGDKAQIDAILAENNAKPDNIEIVHTEEAIEMGESPTQAFVKKPNSSIVVGFDYLKRGLIDGFASAGSTGAMMVGCMQVIKPVDGILRPTIPAPLPTYNGGSVYILDMGLNIDSKPEVLFQYGEIGSIYAKTLGIENPRIGLMNIGEEAEKGNALTKAAFQLMNETDKFNFVGNVESKHIFTGEMADVLVCDGFVGNIVLKMAEGIYPFLAKSKELRESAFVQEMNSEMAGGTPVLGINSTVLIGHGCSSSVAIKNMVLETEKTVSDRLVDKIKEAFADEKN